MRSWTWFCKQIETFSDLRMGYIYFTNGVDVNLWVPETTVLSWIVDSNDVHVLKPGTCVFITSHGERDFEDVIKCFEVKRLSWII